MRAKLSKLLVLSVLFATPVFAADKSSDGAKGKEPTKEERETMAAHHEKMAACLRSDKSFMECHKEMRELWKDGACSMGGRWNGMGRMHRRMGGQAPATEKSESK